MDRSGLTTAMWLLVMFDLPMVDEIDKKRYVRFRRHLLRLGFSMLQFSVYGRPYATDAHVEPARALLRRAIPLQGQVRLLTVTDRQFGRMESYDGTVKKEVETGWSQLVLL